MTQAGQDASGAEVSSGRRLLWREAGWAASAAVVATAVAVWSVRLWEWKVGTPWDFHGDSTFVSMEIRDAIEHGWYWFNPDLGYPFGQVGSLFPELNVLHLAIVKLISLVVPGFYTPGVVYFILGWPLAAITMFLLARHERISHPAAVAIGVLFACAPGHQENFRFLWLSSYWVLPPAVWVILEVLHRRPLLARRPELPRWRSRLTLHNALLIGALVAVGLSGVYYAAFVLILLAVAAVGRRLSGRRPIYWRAGLSAMALVAAVLFVPLLVARHGASVATPVGSPPADRSFVESEVFAGKLMDLILPWPGHRVDGLAYLTWAYNSVTIPTAEVVALGVIGVAGCVALAVAAVRSLLGLRAAAQLRTWALFALVSFAFYTVGGLGSFTALFFVRVVRTWSRFSIVILLFGLLAVGYGLTRLGRRRGQTLGTVVAALVLVIGVLDQTNPSQAPDHVKNASHFANLTAYTAQLERAVGPGCAVFQLPVTPFPETGGLNRMGGYDQLFPYLGSSGLKWSFGAMKGTAEADWQRAVPVDKPGQLVRDLAAAGFCAIEIDTLAFNADTGPRARIAEELGKPISQTADGEFVAYRIPRGLASEGSRDRLLRPVLVALDANVPEVREGMVSQLIGPQGDLRLVNLTDQSIPLHITMGVEVVGSVARDMQISRPDGRPLISVHLPGTGSTPVDIDIEAPYGASTLRLRFSGPALRLNTPSVTASARVSNLRVTTPAPVRAVSLQQQNATGAVGIG